MRRQHPGHRQRVVDGETRGGVTGDQEQHPGYGVRVRDRFEQRTGEAVEQHSRGAHEGRAEEPAHRQPAGPRADIDLARSIAFSLKNQGIRLALDDFGTGFSSLAHLRSLPFDLIKIDRSFVTNIHANKESAAIVRAVTTLASALDVPVCVEGIENEAANSAVIGLGCTTGQGWYFGKAMPGEQAAQLLNRPATVVPASPRRAVG